MDRSVEILVVEDSANIVELLELHLAREGYRVRVARDGVQALEELERQGFDLVILDWMLPRLDGLEVCKRLRARSSVPVLMLTARDEELDKVLGLEMGADDYLTKPFGVRELLARVRALLRRASAAEAPAEAVEIGELRIVPESRMATLRQAPLELTPKEFDLLLFLAQNRGRVFTRAQLLDKVWGYSFEGYERTIDSHIQKLRKKIESDPREPVYLKTVWGVGYRFEYT
jgi:two-component system alkaline phosphatase synthesis response regulator PhoP